jgi:hypothetical protein
MSQRVENTSPPAKPRLILHAGTPKTGTTTLQVCFHQNRQTLINQGILYPAAGIEPNAVPPKHQWLVDVLLNADENRFEKYMEDVLSEWKRYPRVHTIFLSTEGIYNHWWDYPQTAKSLLKSLDRYFDVTVWVVFRNPRSFAGSYYCQVVKNPKFPLVSCYSTSDSIDEVMEDPTFARIFQYGDFVRSIEALFGRPLVLATKYEDGDTLEQARQILGFGENLIKPVARENSGLSAISLDLARQINRRSIDPINRQRCIDMIREIDKFLGPEDRQTAIPDAVKVRIDNLVQSSREFLRDRYNIVWD